MTSEQINSHLWRRREELLPCFTLATIQVFRNKKSRDSYNASHLIIIIMIVSSYNMFVLFVFYMGFLLFFFSSSSSSLVCIYDENDSS